MQGGGGEAWRGRAERSGAWPGGPGKAEAPGPFRSALCALITASDRAPIAFSTPPEALQKATEFFADASCLVMPGVKWLWRSNNVFFNVGWLSNCVDPLARRAHRQPLLELRCVRDWEALSDMLGVGAAALPGSLIAAHAAELVRPAQP